MKTASRVGLILLAIAFSGCRRSAPVFEIREVGCSGNPSDAAWSYECQGTLLTRDNRYSNRQIVVWVLDVSKHHNGEPIYPSGTGFYRLMSSGVATLKTLAYYPKLERFPNGTISGKYENDPGAPQPEWKILGITELEPVQVNVEK